MWAVGRDPAAASVDQPELTQGSWVRDGGVVVEAGFADALDVGEGDQITLRTRLCTLDDAHHARPDCRVANGRSFRVVGVAVTAAAQAVPGCRASPRPAPVRRGHGGREWPRARRRTSRRRSRRSTTYVFMEDPVEPGLVWLTEADARGLAPGQEYLSYVVNLKLADPTDAPAFVDAHLSSSTRAPILESWQDIRDGHDQLVQDARRSPA